MPDHDLLILGGGPAGLSTALHIARDFPHLTPRVLVLEKARYPRSSGSPRRAWCWRATRRGPFPQQPQMMGVVHLEWTISSLQRTAGDGPPRKVSGALLP
jgi:glycine/D-amino acid oxidase-like deaminating enzyme